MKKLFSLFILIISLTLIGCSSGNYNQSNYERITSVAYGVVVEARNIQIEDSGTGSILGAVVGGVIGHQIGGGRGKDVATATGAILGGIAGNQINKSDAQELTVKTENGQNIVVVNKLGEGKHFFKPMDRVKIIYDGNQVRSIQYSR